MSAPAEIYAEKAAERVVTDTDQRKAADRYQQAQRDHQLYRERHRKLTGNQHTETERRRGEHDRFDAVAQFKHTEYAACIGEIRRNKVSILVIHLQSPRFPEQPETAVLSVRGSPR